MGPGPCQLTPLHKSNGNTLSTHDPVRLQRKQWNGKSSDTLKEEQHRDGTLVPSEVSFSVRTQACFGASAPGAVP
ncbi:hypothetical protein J4Q44_G00168020 [Coregonus suidteri]|uniref:Uncharacterized protein n=1 Tax=Coregonus suidteri TaxID=861788 RepID=A0AAN8LKM0_9TELE